VILAGCEEKLSNKMFVERRIVVQSDATDYCAKKNMVLDNIDMQSFEVAMIKCYTKSPLKYYEYRYEYEQD